jgi:hypothetical protein
VKNWKTAATDAFAAPLRRDRKTRCEGLDSEAYRFREQRAPTPVVLHNVCRIPLAGEDANYLEYASGGDTEIIVRNDRCAAPLTRCCPARAAG